MRPEAAGASRARFPVLIGVAALLGGLLVVELRSAAPTGRAGASADRFPLLPAQTVQTVARPDRTAEWVATILARPLFSPTRRPAETAAGGKPAPKVTPRLAGVVVGDGAAGAIFAEAGVPTPILAKPGDRVGPYRIKSIAVGEVTVEGPAGTEVLHPTFAAGVATPAQVGSHPGPAFGVPSSSGPSTAGQIPGQIPGPDAIRELIERQLTQQAK